MEKVVYFQDVAPQICAFVWVAVAVLSAFLVYELVWRQKHPQAAAGKLTSAEKRAVSRRLFFVFAFLFMWILAFAGYLLTITESGGYMYVPFALICLGGLFLCFLFRK